VEKGWGKIADATIIYLYELIARVRLL
jgi:hypothetical protein